MFMLALLLLLSSTPVLGMHKLTRIVRPYARAQHLVPNLRRSCPTNRVFIRAAGTNLSLDNQNKNVKKEIEKMELQEKICTAEAGRNIAKGLRH